MTMFLWLDLVIIFWKSIAWLLFILVSICQFTTTTTKNDEQWSLVDNYNFDNFISQSSKRFWHHSNWLVDDEPENLCTGMNIYQYSCHRKENVQVNKKGYLEIIASVNKNSKTGYHERFLFNSGKIASNKSWLYGRFEMRAILPEGRSLRSVFILRPAKPRYPGDWLDNGQINGLVYAQQRSAIIAGIHYKMPAGQSYMGRKLYTQRNITQTFNIYVIEWSNQSIRWFFNDFLFFEHNVTKPFDQKFNLVLQLGVGGPEFDTRSGVMRQEDAKHWVNNRFIIDYVKVYQRKLSTTKMAEELSSSSNRNNLPKSSIIYYSFLIHKLFIILAKLNFNV